MRTALLTVAAVFGLAACTNTQEPLNANFGDAYYHNIAVQVIDPKPAASQCRQSCRSSSSSMSFGPVCTPSSTFGTFSPLVNIHHGPGVARTFATF